MKENTRREPLPDTARPGDVLTAVQLCPFGSFPGEKSLQVCDRAAFEQLVADWKANGSPEILMDFEHQSEVDRIDSDTRAAAWITNLAVDDARGLVGDLRLTDAGADAIANRRLRFLSPTWYTDGGGRPAHMTSVALTNKPNIPVAPILNKGPAPGVKHVEETKGPNMDVNKIKEALGLPADATDEQVLAAVKEGRDAKSRAAKMQAEAEKAALDKEAEEFAEKNAGKCDKEVLRAQYVANKEVARALVAGIPAAKEEPQKILNKGKAPAAGADAAGRELQRNKALSEYRAAHKCDFATAWGACRAADPELFAD